MVSGCIKADESYYKKEKGVMKFFFSATRRRDIKILLSVGPHTEKFYIVMNDHGRTHKCDFSVFDQKYFKIASLS